MECASIAPWSELLPELVGCIVTRLPTAADCARFRAVCRSWRSAMRHHGSLVRHPPPWVVFLDGRFLTSFHGRSTRSRRLASFLENATCVGSTGSWLALCLDDAENQYQCLLHDPFTGTTVLRHDLDTIIGDMPNNCFLRKILMPRDPADDMALATIYRQDYSFVLASSGKAAGLPIEQITTSRGTIVDIAFLGGKLYGITLEEDLYLLDIDFGDHGIPIVTRTRLVIDNPASEESNDAGEEEDINELPEGIDDFIIITVSYLVESRGKLFLVKQQLIYPTYKVHFTRKVQVFEADVKEGAWKPLVGGLGGQALFISNSLVKFVPACGEIEEDAVYFMDKGGVVSVRSQTNMAPHAHWNQDYEKLMPGVLDLHDGPKWIFPPDLVV